MRSPSFVLRHARREARSSFRRIGVYMGSIGLGVAALVAVHGFRGDVTRSVAEEARILMGADARLSADRPLPDSVTRIVDSLVATGVRRADVTGAVSMVVAPATGAVRLLQVRGVDGTWPLYGNVRTRPEELWGRAGPGSVLVDPAVLTQLDVAVGDSLVVGRRRLRIAGTVDGLPTELGFQTAVGPRVWLTGEDLRSAGLLGFGSLARYETFLARSGSREPLRVGRGHRATLRASRVDFDTAEEQARSMNVGVEYLGRYLGLVGLAALLLGGIGVASAAHVFAREKLTDVAVLRCLGARQQTAFLAYLLLAAAMGLVGSGMGAAVGLAVQWALPEILAGALPVRVEARIGPAPAVAGIGVGLGVSVLFVLVPLLAIRNAPPLRALRRDFERDRPRGDPWQWAAWAALAATVAALAVWEAPEAGQGLAFAGALAVTAALLWITARLLSQAARRLLLRRAPYPVRQGLANLHRPRNQTVAVTLALGFGAFVVGTVLEVQTALAGTLRFDADADRPNLLLFDIQPDQVEGVLDLLPPTARGRAEVTPIVPARLASVNGRTPAELRADSGGARPERWALRREYRHTYRRDLTDTETLVAGRWWAPDDTAVGDGSPARPAHVSLEEGIAADLAVGLGDTLTWDVAGREVASVVASIRRVDWRRFRTNFFVVFEPGTLEDAPHMSVLLTHLDGEEARVGFQRRLQAAYPNVSALDVTRIQETLASILGKVDRAIRFLALFCAAAGLLVLAAALATSRYQRMREAALLRTLGARRRQVLAVLVTEYVALGSLTALAGLVLAVGAGSLVTTRVFGLHASPAGGPLVVVWAGITVLTLATGLLGGRGFLSRPPLQVLRETED